MPASDHHFAEFRPHSKHKHLILEHYIRGWTRKLLLRRNAGNRVRLIDACAGPGHDDAGNPGSPILAARVAAEARAQLGTEFQRDVRIDVTAIEPKASYFNALQLALEPFGESVVARRGTLGDHVDDLDRDGRGIPTFYFIDPFGLAPLQAALLRRVLSEPETEVFLLFSDQAALRHFGAVQSVETRAVKRLRDHDEHPTLFVDMDREVRETLHAKAAASQEAQTITRERAIQILDAAFGGRDWLEEIERTHPNQRRQRFLALYSETLVDAGAPYILAVPMLDADGDHVYFLVHASRSPSGHQLMKESVEYALNRSPLPQDAVDSVWNILRTDPRPIADFVRERFAGQTVRWTEDKDDRAAPWLRKIVLGETALYPFQVDELKELLKPHRLPGRTLAYRFPA